MQPTFTQPLLTAEPMHPPAHSPTAFGGRCRAAVPALSGANIGSGARSGAGLLPGSGQLHKEIDDRPDSRAAEASRLGLEIRL